MKKIIEIEELQKCSCCNLRLMARELTNEYNNNLKYSGINSTQIPILAILNIYGQVETSKIASLLNLEISTVRRNLSILIKKKLIKVIQRNVIGNLHSLSNEGSIKLKEILPAWRKSNKLGKKKIKHYIKVLKTISK